MLNFVRADQFRGTLAPCRAIEFQLTVTPRDLAVGVVLSGQLKLAGQVVSDLVTSGQAASPRSSSGTQCQLWLRVALTAESVKAIEVHRASLPAHTAMRPELTLILLRQAGQAQTSARGELEPNGFIDTTTCTGSFEIEPSQWARALKQMGWAAATIFEVPELPVADYPGATEGRAILAQAHELLLAGNFKGCIARSVDSFEAAAKHVDGPDGGQKPNYDRLATNAFAPDDPRAAFLNAQIKALRAYGHTAARHEQRQAIHNSREEAEFVYASATALMSFISRSIHHRP